MLRALVERNLHPDALARAVPFLPHGIVGPAFCGISSRRAPEERHFAAQTRLGGRLVEPRSLAGSLGVRGTENLAQALVEGAARNEGSHHGSFHRI